MKDGMLRPLRADGTRGEAAGAGQDNLDLAHRHDSRKHLA